MELSRAFVQEASKVRIRIQIVQCRNIAVKFGLMSLRGHVYLIGSYRRKNCVHYHCRKYH